jgi:hypothetical protein
MAWRGFYLFYPTLMKKKLSHTEAVFEELNHIKAVATKAELRKLVVKLVDPSESRNCIYGLMTGHCNSDRAQLIMKDLNFSHYYPSINRPLALKKGKLFGRYGRKLYTPLERHIYQYPEDIKGIVAYLRGRKDVVGLNR